MLPSRATGWGEQTGASETEVGARTDRTFRTERSLASSARREVKGNAVPPSARSHRSSSCGVDFTCGLSSGEEGSEGLSPRSRGGASTRGVGSSGENAAGGSPGRASSRDAEREPPCSWCFHPFIYRFPHWCVVHVVLLVAALYGCFVMWAVLQLATGDGACPGVPLSPGFYEYVATSLVCLAVSIPCAFYVGLHVGNRHRCYGVVAVALDITAIAMAVWGLIVFFSSAQAECGARYASSTAPALLPFFAATFLFWIMHLFVVGAIVRFMGHRKLRWLAFGDDESGRGARARRNVSGTSAEARPLNSLYMTSRWSGTGRLLPSRGGGATSFARTPRTRASVGSELEMTEMVTGTTMQQYPHIAAGASSVYGHTSRVEPSSALYEESEVTSWVG